MVVIVQNNISISICQKSEYNKLTNYINQFWKKNHVLVQSKTLLDWQHKDNENYNFVVAKDQISGDFIGIMGFIPVSHFDKSFKKHGEFWGAIWHVLDSSPVGLGLDLMTYFEKEYSVKFNGAIGINNLAKKIYYYLGRKIGTLNHYYILNNKISNFNIANVEHAVIKNIWKNDSLEFKEIFNLTGFFLRHKYKPRKSLKYLINRYQKHPLYKYRFFGIFKSDLLICIWVIRKQFVGEASCLRIVDMFGDVENIENIFSQVQELLIIEKSEYIDCLNYGINNSTFRDMGFELLDYMKNTIVPNYFEPFEKRNVKIDFAIKTEHEEFVIFKGDADQDRPSII